MKDLFYSAGIILTFILGIWNVVNNYRASRRTSFINTVTAERVKWIEKVRENISVYCGLIHAWATLNMAKDPKSDEVLKQIDKLKYLVRLQLNPDGEHDKVIEDFIARIPHLAVGDLNVLMNALNDLTGVTQKLLKEEWEKVKEESMRGNLKEDEHWASPILRRMNKWCLERTKQWYA